MALDEIQTLFRSWTLHLSFGFSTLPFSSQNGFVTCLNWIRFLTKIPTLLVLLPPPKVGSYPQAGWGEWSLLHPQGSPEQPSPAPALQHPLSSFTLCYRPPWQSVTFPWSSFPRFSACQQATAGTLLRICPRLPSAVRKGCFFLYIESCEIESPFFSCQRAETWRFHVHLELEHMVLSWRWRIGGNEMTDVQHEENTNMKALPGFPSGWELHLHRTQILQFVFSSSLSPEPQRTDICMKHNTFKYWEHLKTQPFTPGREISEVEVAHLWAWLTRRRAQGGNEAPTEPGPLFCWAAGSPWIPWTWNEAEGKLGFPTGCAPQHCCENLAVKTQLDANQNPVLTLALGVQYVQ